MTSTTPRQRDLAKTRRALLTAARDQVKRRGVSVSLDAIARSSGVSKGGLLHHFPSKVALLVALAEDIYRSFEVEFARLSDLEPEGPGRTLRAYVRATIHELRTPDLLLEHGTMLNLISTVPQVSELVARRVIHWSEQVAADGLSPDVVRLVMLATDGIAVGMLTGSPPTDRELTRVEEQLIALVDAHEQVARLLEPTTKPTGTA